jgi:hypothetical protein
MLGWDAPLTTSVREYTGNLLRPPHIRPHLIRI